MTIRKPDITSMLNLLKHLRHFLAVFDQLVTVLMAELLTGNEIFVFPSDALELFQQVFLSNLIILADFLLNLSFVTIIKYGKHEVEEHVESHKQVSKEEHKRECIVSSPEWKENIRKITCCKQDDHGKDTCGDVLEEPNIIFVLKVSEEDVAKNRHKGYVRYNDDHNR